MNDQESPQDLQKNPVALDYRSKPYSQIGRNLYWPTRGLVWVASILALVTLPALLFTGGKRMDNPVVDAFVNAIPFGDLSFFVSTIVFFVFAVRLVKDYRRRSDFAELRRGSCVWIAVAGLLYLILILLIVTIPSHRSEPGGW